MKIKFGIKPEYRHIPITEEVLKSCGFKQNGFKDWVLKIPKIYSASNRILSFSGDYLYLMELEYEERDPNDHLICIWNKDLMNKFYLDELQSLYYSLTGEELTVNI